MEITIKANPQDIVDIISAISCYNSEKVKMRSCNCKSDDQTTETSDENVSDSSISLGFALPDAKVGNHMSIGENLRKLREKAGLSQNELARRANVTPAAINMIEKGTRNLALATGKDIADVLGCSLYDFFDGSNREAV